MSNGQKYPTQNLNLFGVRVSLLIYGWRDTRQPSVVRLLHRFRCANLFHRAARDGPYVFRAKTSGQNGTARSFGEPFLRLCERPIAVLQSAANENSCSRTRSSRAHCLAGAEFPCPGVQTNAATHLRVRAAELNPVPRT